MALLNIQQFVERVHLEINLCDNCFGKMYEIPIKTRDAIKLIFGKPKIIKRYKCADCSAEIKTEQ